MAPRKAICRLGHAGRCVEPICPAVGAVAAPRHRSDGAGAGDDERGADAFIAAWHVKFKHWTQRPVHAIGERLVPGFLPYLLTPPFPAYVSGHATASGAAAEVLSAYFPGQTQQLLALADEAAQSRLFGGIHFPSDNEQGLRLGREIGQRVLARVIGSGQSSR